MLENLRERISAVNSRILGDLNERLRLVNEVRDLKKERGLPMHDPAREEQMMRELVATNPGPLSETHLAIVFKAIFSVCLSFLKHA